jgi:four helix bundle protein
VAGAKSFEDLHAWRLCVALCERIFELTAAGTVARDVHFCSQIRDSARSAPRNIAEGFGAYRPREFARFMRIARRSLHETKNHILEGRRREYFSEAAEADLLTMYHRAQGATTGLLRYLERCNGMAPNDWTQAGR